MHECVCVCVCVCVCMCVLVRAHVADGTTYIFGPHAADEDLVLLIQIHVDESEGEGDGDRRRHVDDGPSVQTQTRVVRQQLTAQSLLCRHRCIRVPAAIKHRVCEPSCTPHTWNGAAAAFCAVCLIKARMTCSAGSAPLQLSEGTLSVLPFPPTSVERSR